MELLDRMTIIAFHLLPFNWYQSYFHAMSSLCSYEYHSYGKDLEELGSLDISAFATPSDPSLEIAISTVRGDCRFLAVPNVFGYFHSFCS